MGEKRTMKLVLIGKVVIKCLSIKSCSSEIFRQFHCFLNIYLDIIRFGLKGGEGN
jgi:hypothetical protein